MKRQINQIPLLITKSENIEGFLTLEKAIKHQIGIFNSIDFKTYCKLNNKSTNYDSNYVILTKTGKWLFPYNEPFTNESVTDIDKRVIRGANNTVELIYTSNDYNLTELTLGELGQIFPDDESLEEYKTLFRAFYNENKLAFYETKEIREREEKTKDNSLNLDNPNEERGIEIYNELINSSSRVDKILERLLDERIRPKKVYTIRK